MDEFNKDTLPSAPRGDEHTEPQQPVNEMPAAPDEAPQAQPAASEAPQAQSQAPQAEETTPYQTPVQHPAYQPPQAEQPAPPQPPVHTVYAEAGRVPPPPQPKPKKKKKGNGIIIGLCSVAAACLLFAGGAVIGSLADGGPKDAVQAFGKDNMPTVTISQAPSVGADNYDTGDGLAGEEIYKKVNPSIVSIISVNMNGTGGTGSGVIMTEDGYIITNNHVVTDEQTGAHVDQVTVQLDDGSRLPAQIIGNDEKTDLAVLKVEPTGALTAAEFGDSDKLQPGEYAYAIGSPGGVELANTITGGRISAINRDITIDDRVMTLIQTDASINPGNSGGALINKYGQVVGITSAKLGISYYEGLGFAIPMNTVKGVVDELIANGYVAGRPSIGITGYNVSEQTAQYSNVPQGVYVVSVDERAHAYQEGLQPKDIITKVNGETITSMNEINAIKEEMKAGDKLQIQVYRMTTGKLVDLTITLTDEHDLQGEPPSQQQQSQQPESGDNGYSRYGEGEDPFSYFFNW